MSRLCESQVQAGARVEVWTTTANGPDELSVPAGVPQDVDGVKVVYFRRWTGDHSHFSPPLLWRIWREAGHFDVVHLHSWWNLATMPAVLLCWLRGVQPVLSPRGMLSAYSFQSRGKRLFHRLLGRWLLGRTVLHATSAQEAREIRTLQPTWPCFVAPNLIDLPTAPLAWPAPATHNKLQLVFISRLHHKKGLDLLLAALADVDFPWQLQVAGSGEAAYEAELQQQAETLGLASHIQWLGWLAGDAKNELLAGADLVVLPSRNENFALVVLEALALGAPVLVTNQVGLSDFVLTHQLGWVCPPTVADLRTQLAAAYQQTHRRHDIRARAPELVRRHFAASQVTARYLAAYTIFAKTT